MLKRISRVLVVLFALLMVLPREVMASELINVETTKKGNKVEFSISNLSQDPIHDVYLVADENNKKTDSYTIFNVGSMDSQKGIKLTVDEVSVPRVLRSMSYKLGGFNYLVVIGVILLCGLILGITALIFLHRRGLRLCVVVVSAVLVVTCIFSGITYSVLCSKATVYKPGKSGSVITRDVKVGKNMYQLRYNRDDITTEVSESDVEIPFDTEYTYDDSIACTEEPTITAEGSVGMKHVTTTTYYINGVKDREEVSESVTTDPVSAKAVQGTKSTVNIESIPAKCEYVAEPTIMVGEKEIFSSEEEAEEALGKKEVTYTWDEGSKSVVSSTKITKEPGTVKWKAGSMLKKSRKINATTEYVAREDMAVGYRNVLAESVDGSEDTYYIVGIDSKTGMVTDEKHLKYDHEEITPAQNGSVEVGVLSVQNVSTPLDVTYQEDENRWDNYSKVIQDGVDRVESVTNIMKMDAKTGIVSTTVEREVSREVVSEGTSEVVLNGTKKPNWVEEKKVTDTINYKTTYVADDSLSGDEQQVAVEGKNGSLTTTMMVAVDEEGNVIASYKPKIVEENAVTKPIDAVVHVAPDSSLLG